MNKRIRTKYPNSDGTLRAAIHKMLLTLFLYEVQGSIGQYLRTRQPKTFIEIANYSTLYRTEQSKHSLPYTGPRTNPSPFVNQQLPSPGHHSPNNSGNQDRTTACISIEGILNSRPLTPVSNDANDLEVLTPGHFLIGRPLTAIPEPDITNVSTNRLSRWALTQKIQQDFWKRWSLEYLNTLQQRLKWQHPREDVKTGDMVLIKDENLPPTKWRLGRVLELFPGKDSLVRVVSIKTSSSVMKRAVSRIVRLPMNS
ncbi:hypothetical protein WDU94_010834 [Cyamophila willieti]